MFLARLKEAEMKVFFFVCLSNNAIRDIAIVTFCEGEQEFYLIFHIDEEFFLYSFNTKSIYQIKINFTQGEQEKRVFG